MYEIHIATPVMDPALRKTLRAALERIGLAKCKYFYLVANIPALYDRFVPPGGKHDLANPGSMFSTRLPTYAQAEQCAVSAMRLLAKHGVVGNFEIEKILAPGMAADEVPPLPTGFKQSEGAPVFENHLVWKGPRWTLPSFESIIRLFEEKLWVRPHQIVDFGPADTSSDVTIVTRVATVYQPRLRETLGLDASIRQLPFSLGANRSVAEQVICVGEPA